MGIHDLKTRLGDIPGIQSLSMDLSGGRIALTWGDGYSAAVDATASDGEIEAAVRNAVKLPPVGLIPDKPLTASAPASAPTPAARPASGHPAETVGALDRVMSDHVRMMSDIHAAQLKILESTLARQRDSVASGVGTMAAQIDRQTDDFNAMMARWTNGGN